MLFNKVDQEEIQKNIQKNHVSQNDIDKDTHYSDKELLNLIKSKGTFSREQEDFIKSLNSESSSSI